MRFHSGKTPAIHTQHVTPLLVQATAASKGAELHEQQSNWCGISTDVRLFLPRIRNTVFFFFFFFFGFIH